MLKGMKNKEYISNITRFRINNPEKTQNIRGDLNLIETYKTQSGKENVNRDTFFHLIDSERQLRGHGLKLYKRRCRHDTRKFFSQRVVNNWNSLPQLHYVVEAPSLNSFKKRLDDYYKDMGLL